MLDGNPRAQIKGLFSSLAAKRVMQSETMQTQDHFISLKLTAVSRHTFPRFVLQVTYWLTSFVNYLGSKQWQELSYAQLKFDQL